MGEKKCKDCQYFWQHYTFDKRKVFRVCCGHCTLSRARRKRPDSKVCESFILGTAQEEAFVSREYLSKELLAYLLSLELLPEIEDKA